LFSLFNFFVSTLSKKQLLTAKETIYLVNLTSWDYHRDRQVPITEEIESYLVERGEKNPAIIQISLEFEERLYHVELNNQLEEYQNANPRHLSCSTKIFKEIRSLLSIIHYFTFNEEEIKCWMIRYGSNMIDAAGKMNVRFAR
jgi:ribosome-binding ATPase YchF (GTP1/OBG family)